MKALNIFEVVQFKRGIDSKESLEIGAASHPLYKHWKKAKEDLNSNTFTITDITRDDDGDWFWITDNRERHYPYIDYGENENHYDNYMVTLSPEGKVYVITNGGNSTAYPGVHWTPEEVILHVKSYNRHDK